MKLIRCITIQRHEVQCHIATTSASACSGNFIYLPSCCFFPAWLTSLMKSEARGETYEWMKFAVRRRKGRQNPKTYKTKINIKLLLRCSPLACQNQFVFFLPSTSREAKFMFIRDSLSLSLSSDVCFFSVHYSKGLLIRKNVREGGRTGKKRQKVSVVIIGIFFVFFV